MSTTRDEPVTPGERQELLSAFRDLRDETRSLKEALTGSTQRRPREAQAAWTWKKIVATVVGILGAVGGGSYGGAGIKMAQHEWALQAEQHENETQGRQIQTLVLDLSETRSDLKVLKVRVDGHDSEITRLRDDAPKGHRSGAEGPLLQLPEAPLLRLHFEARPTPPLLAAMAPG